MLVSILNNKYIGTFGIILGLLVFNIGIAVPLSTMAITNLALNQASTSASTSSQDDTTDKDNNAPIEEEEESRRAPIPGSEEEDEKSKEMFDPWKRVRSSLSDKNAVSEIFKLAHVPFEVSTPPPEA